MARRPDRSKYDRVVGDGFDDGSDEDDVVVLDSKDTELQNLLHRPTANMKEGATIATGADTYHDGETLDGPPYTDTESASFDPNEPTPRELTTLRRVPDRLPRSAFLVAIVELCERFSYYGLSGPFQNYISNHYLDAANPGALGLGQSSATALTNFFQFWCYITPLFGAIVADQWLGKYKTIVYFALIYLLGLTILFITSLPVSIEGGYALAGLVCAMFVIGLGTGGIKSNVSPLIAEQITETRVRVRTERGGERVLVDPALTVQRVYMVFYMCINLGSLSSIATTNMELHTGFWSAYLLALCMFVVGLVVLVLGRGKYVVRPPKGSVIAHSVKALWIGVRSKRGLEAAKPSVRMSLGMAKSVPWDDAFVEELKTALKACKVFLFFPIYWAVYGQMNNNFVSQAGTMELHGIPNDIMQNIDPITIIIFIPLCDQLLYPTLRTLGIKFKPITRIFWGFLMASIAMAYAAYVQHLIYSSGPCYTHPLKCDAAFLTSPTPNDPTLTSTPSSLDITVQHNSVHVALQTPAYFFVALSEIFASITGLEYAYTKSPEGMRSFIMALFLLTNSGGAVVGILLAPVAKDPNLTALYAGLACLALVGGCAFWGVFRGYNSLEDERNDGMVGGGVDVGLERLDGNGKAEDVS
ncbi:PTR2-domain-containing protein [Microthyrium microscopicum]|uniref:PTR2-domain-containing protein n=1 Tax=Microthyrium microscopicum TaxID=703497 RepID=A0A6A6UFD1_9PEZI|nr:PTR2-domain-containing protein [Microthyrium microscopicum]